MVYNIYIKTESQTFNIRSLTKDNLLKVVNAYNQGKTGFFINGTKYIIENLLNIKVFTFENSESFNDFINQPKIKNSLKPSGDGKFYLDLHQLAKLGSNVTDQYIMRIKG